MIRNNYSDGQTKKRRPPKERRPVVMTAQVRDFRVMRGLRRLL